jgi:hypothetical protein
MHWLEADGTGPVTIEAHGTSPSKGLWDAAVEMKVSYTFENPDWTLTWNQPGDPVEIEQRTSKEQSVPLPKIAQPAYGAVFRGENGETTVWGGADDLWAERKVREWNAAVGEPEVIVSHSPGHYEDWFQSIQTGDKTIMNIEAAVGVANLCNLGNLSFILERKLTWDPSKGDIVGDEGAKRLLGRPQRFPYAL